MRNHPTTFYIVRHGESVANVKKIVQGYSTKDGDSHLTDKGKIQAEDLTKLFRNQSIDAIYSSDAVRAKETATIIATALHLPVHISQELRERSFGKYEGMNIDAFLSLYKNFNTLSTQKKLEYQIDENEESNLSGANRLIRFLQTTADANPGKVIIISTHGGIIRALLIYKGLGDFDTIGGFDNCGYIKVLADNNSLRVEETKGIKKWEEKHPILITN